MQAKIDVLTERLREQEAPLSPSQTFGPRWRVGFIMRTEVGLKTQYLNWRAFLAPEYGIDPEWITIDWWREGGLVERLPLVPGEVKVRLRAWSDLRAGLARGPFDALFLAGHTIPGIGRALKRQPYFITTDVTARLLSAFGAMYKQRANRFSFIEQRKHQGRCALYRGASALFPWSRWAAVSMVEDYGADPDRIHVIPPGVDVDRWKCPPRSQDGPVNILFVGGDFPRKGGDLLLDWAAKTDRRGWRLHLVTRSPIEPSGENIRVYNHLSPNDTELMRLYQESHLFVLPTRGDCYSLAGIEAMAAGLPVILSRTGGTGDIIRDEVTGYLIPPGDANALSERLEYLLDHPQQRVRMGEAARKDAEERFDARRNIQRTVDILRRCLARP
jgi:glycosyltransferase involved in cell wall biosynthesis